MSKNETIDRLRSINGNIARGYLKTAYDEMLSLSEQKMQWEVSADIKTAITNYNYMLSYFIDGIVDPNLGDVFGKMQDSAWMLFDRLRRAIDIPGSSTLYFGKVRTRQSNPQSVEALTHYYIKALDDDADIIGRLTADESTTTYRGQKPKENALSDIFDYIWTQHPLKEDECTRLVDMIDSIATKYDTYDCVAYTATLIAALMLGDLQYADTTRRTTMARIYHKYAETQPQIAIKALCALLTMLFRHRARPLSRPLKDMLAVLADMPTWDGDVKTVFLELIRTRNTENVNRTMRQEIIPGVNKMRDNIFEHIKDHDIPENIIDPTDLENIEINPEWESMLEKSGVADGLKRLGEMQQDGADVFMSTFAHLKNFAFFHEVANWFLPFNPEHSQVVDAVGAADELAQVINNLSFLCDSDKYSMALSVDMIPATQRDFIVGQLTQHRDQLLEQMSLQSSAMSDRSNATSIAARIFLQGFYRFVKLFRRKNEFTDPYRDGLNLLSVRELTPYIHDINMVKLVGEYYFKYEYWADALIAFRFVDEHSDALDVALYQKIGYCHEQTGEYAAALSAYERAELLDDSSRWLQRRIAYANRCLNRHGQALKYYKRLADEAPEDNAAALALAYAYIRLERWDKALAQLRKVEFINPDDKNIWRPMAWVLFVTGDYEGSRKFWQRVLADNPSADDYFNMGHLAAATGQIREALNYYKLSQPDGNSESLIKRINDDKKVLRQAGLDDIRITLLEEALYNRAGNA